jgi:type I restriction enzyme S subunit
MKSNYKKLGEFIRPIDERNGNGLLGEDNLYGISVTKEFIVSHANLVGVTFDGYKVVAPRQFAYIPDTSRRGEKIAISLNTTGQKIIVSSICTVFEISDDELLLPEFLMLWFMRPEFDRYARFMSNGSAREVFDWDCLCGVELPIPSIEEQRKIVQGYQVISKRMRLLGQINDNLAA